MEIAAGEDDGTVFYNPVQVQNRDLSVLMIVLHAERRRANELEKHEKRRQRGKQTKEQQQSSNNSSNNNNKKQQEEKGDEQTKEDLTKDPTETKTSDGDKPQEEETSKPADDDNDPESSPGETTTEKIKIPGLCVLDALAASGLRSLRYWKECHPYVEHVTINDLDPAACERAVRNVHLNDLAEHLLVDATTTTTLDDASPRPPGIRIRTGDATDLLYSSRQPNRNRVNTPIQPVTSDRQQWDVIDLDPYGSAAPFMDGAVQAVAHQGLLCVTCTDMAALGGSHPETCFGRYAGMPVARAGYLQELALRLVLHSLAVSAARYGRTLRPILSVGMDFYVRCFVEVRDDKAGVKSLSLQAGSVYQSAHCPTFECVPAGQLGGQKGNVYQPRRLPHGTCPDTGAAWKVGGPLWLGPLHDRAVLRRALQRLDPEQQPPQEQDDDGDPQQQQPPPLPRLSLLATRERLRGLLRSCYDELPDCPLFYRLPDLSQTLRVSTPPVADVQSALVNAGYRVSGYHKDPQALKTDAPSTAVWDVLRAWAQKHPPKKPPPEGSAAAKILAAEPTIKVDFTPAASVLEARRADDGVKRFPMNPQAHWGPKPRASGKKRKAAAANDEEAAAGAVQEEKRKK